MIGQRPSAARRTSLLRTLVLAIAALAASLLAGTPARAQYEVAGNAVDVTAASAVQARERALAEAQQAAARRLMERLVVPAGGTPPRLSAAQAAALVQDVEIADERVTPVRYMATVTVRFRPEAVRRFLSEQGIPYSDRAQRPTLVLPVLDLPDGPVLFDDRNLWLRAWSERRSDGALVVPLGDLADVGALSAAQALAADRARIAVLARRYGTDAVAVVRAGRGSGDGVTVAVTRFAGDAPAVSQRASYPDPERTFAAAVRGTAQALDRPLAPPPGAVPVVGGGPDGADYASAPTGSAEEWVQLRRRIAQTPGVERVDIVTLAAGRARLRITHRLGHERLRQAMAPLGVEVEAPEAPVPAALVPAAPAAVPPASAPVPLVPAPLR